jgi:phosphoglycolate phosphatase
MRYSVLSLDLDGTMVDTAAEIVMAVHRTLDDFGLPRLDAAIIAGFIGAGTRETLRRTLERLREDTTPPIDTWPLAALMACLDGHYGATAGTLGQAYPGCALALQRLRSAGVRLACLTNKEHHFAIKVLSATGLLPHFDCVVGGDSLAYRKPQPEALLHVIQVLGGQPAHSAHIGDSRIDVETALAAKVAAWAVPWGYNGGVPIAEARPQRLFQSLPEVADFVLAANRST